MSDIATCGSFLVNGLVPRGTLLLVWVLVKKSWSPLDSNPRPLLPFKALAIVATNIPHGVTCYVYGFIFI
jgi:hypothetical protein